MEVLFVLALLILGGAMYEKDIMKSAFLICALMLCVIAMILVLAAGV